jgi:hypothetical protein
MDTRTSPIRLRLDRLREGDGPGRRARAAGAVGRPAPERIPARPLAGPRVVLGLHRVDGHAGGDARPRGAVCRQPLLGAGRAELAGTGIAGEDPHRRATAHIDWLAAGAAPAHGGGGRPGAGPGRGAHAAGRAGQGRRAAAHRRRPAGRRLARAPGAARAAGLRTPRRRTPCRARPSWRGARGDGAARRHAPLRVHRRRHRLDHQPARQRRQLQPGVPGPPAGRPDRRHAVRRRRQGRRRPGRRLAADGVRLAPYARPPAALAALPAAACCWSTPSASPTACARRWPPGVRVVEAINPSTLPRAARPPPRPLHRAQAMAEDGAAMCEFYAWFEKPRWRAGERITELTVDES